MQNSFGVAMGPELVAARQEIRTEIAVIINFAVERDPDGLVLIGDGLVTARQIDDAQAAVSQAHGSIQVKALIIRPSMRHRVRSALKRNGVGGLTRTEIVNSTNAAHKQLLIVECRLSIGKI
jgi:hypothetical protein